MHCEPSYAGYIAFGLGWLALGLALGMIFG